MMTAPYETHLQDRSGVIVRNAVSTLHLGPKTTTLASMLERNGHIGKLEQQQQKKTTQNPKPMPFVGVRNPRPLGTAGWLPSRLAAAAAGGSRHPTAVRTVRWWAGVGGTGRDSPTRQNYATTAAADADGRGASAQTPPPRRNDDAAAV